MARPSKRALERIRELSGEAGLDEPAIEVRSYRFVFGPGPVEEPRVVEAPAPAPTFNARLASLAADIAAVAERLGVHPRNVNPEDVEAYRAQRARAEAEAVRLRRATPAAREALLDDGWAPLAPRVKR